MCAVPDIDFVRSPERYTKKRLAPSGPTRVYDRGRSREREARTLRDSSNAFFTRHFCVGEGSFASSSQSSTSRKDARVASDSFTLGLSLSRARFRGDFSARVRRLAPQ